METSRVSRSERRAERKRKSDFPQLAPAPDDYPVFPDTSTWPVVFPAAAALAGRRPPSAAAAHLQGGRPVDSGRAAAQSRRDRDGRQRPLGHPARPAACRRPQDGRGGRHRYRLWRNRNRHQVAQPLCVLHRELEALRRRSPFPDGVQPRRGATPPGEPQRDGCEDPLGGFAATPVAQRHQRVGGRRGT